MSGGAKNLTPSSRLYVGSLGLQATQKDLEDLFGKHGKIMEVRLNRNFAFVQFTSELEAKAAIDDLNGQNHFGRKLDVQFAKAPRNSGNNQDKNQSDNQDHARDRSPLSKDMGRGDVGRGGGRGGMRGGRGGGMGGPGGDTRGIPSLFSANKDSPFQSRDSPGGGFRDDSGGFRGGDSRPFGRDSGPRDFGPNDNFRNDRGGGNFRGGNNFRDNDRDSGGFNPWADNFRPGGGGGGGNDFRGSGDFHGGNDRDNFRDKPPLLGGFRGPQDRFGPRDQFRDSPAFRGGDIDPWAPPGDKDPWTNQDAPPTKPPGPLNVPNSDRINDIEIIVMNKSLTDYGEFIETRMKALGFTVDLMFPNESASLLRVIGNIASRGTLYAIVVNPAHKVNRSMTLEILHGTPQEHRNMLLEDAITFLNRNYESYTKAANLKRGVESPPEQIRHLLDMIMSGSRKITVPQCDILIQHFIQEKIKLEPPSNQESAIPVTQQAELQTRILSILNKSGGGTTPNASQQTTPQGVPPPATQPDSGPKKDTPSPLLKDPSVQRALDNLMQGGRNLFSNFNQGNQRGGTFNQF